MCKHVLNAQVAIRSPCCRKWFDCAECHAENETHTLKKVDEMTFACKKCKKCFRRDVSDFEDDSAAYCPHCDNHFVLEAKAAQENGKIAAADEDARMHYKILHDERMKLHDTSMLLDDDLSFRVG